MTTQTYIAECIELGLDVSLTEDEQIELAEAGGLLSWLKRAYIGMDSSLLDELEEELKGRITTEREKRETLRDIDKFVQEGKGPTGTQLVYHLFAPHGPIGPIVSFILRTSNTNSGERGKYVEAMKKIRDKVSALKVKD